MSVDDVTAAARAVARLSDPDLPNRLDACEVIQTRLGAAMLSHATAMLSQQQTHRSGPVLISAETLSHRVWNSLRDECSYGPVTLFDERHLLSRLMSLADQALAAHQVELCRIIDGGCP